MKIDKSKFIATFKSEAEGYLLTLNQGLVRLEKDPKNTELLNELFRAAHTLKGSARMMGFTEIRDVAHKIEDLLGALAEGSLIFTAGAATSVFQALDAISRGIENVSGGEQEGINVEEICNNLVAVSRGEEGVMGHELGDMSHESRAVSHEKNRILSPLMGEGNDAQHMTRGTESHESRVMRHEKECPKKKHDSCLMTLLLLPPRSTSASL
jgi:chemotaxis protein histidine kinase CheA